MKEIYNKNYSEISVKSFIINKILLILLLLVFAFLSVYNNNPEVFKNKFSENQFYVILDFETKKIDNEKSEISAMNLTGFDLKQQTKTVIEIPTEAYIDYSCGNYRSPINQMYEAVAINCIVTSVENIFNVKINEVIKNDEQGESEVLIEGNNLTKYFTYIDQVKLRTMNMETDKLDYFSLEEWETLFSITDYSPEKITAITTEEFQRRIIQDDEIKSDYDSNVCNVTLKKEKNSDYNAEFDGLDNKSVNACREMINKQLGMISTPYDGASFDFEDNYEKGLWPIDSKFDNIDTPVDSDTDLDGISDVFDLCPDVYGPGTIDGCAIIDSDLDGIEDLNDLCPYVFAPGTMDGCVVKIDSDEDGILDEMDSCPTEYAPGTLDGCPVILDSDEDGILDDVDSCPNEYAPDTEDGCVVKPKDTDNDGIIDDQDSCPTEPGTLNGCPDADNDEFIDSQDNCPTESGILNGCPDIDNDGIADYEDTCINGEGTGCELPPNESAKAQIDQKK